jgi:beta-lactam-binding protein with PASTA domain
VGLILSAADNGQRYVMPSFLGRSVAEATDAVQKAGLTMGKVHVSDAGIGAAGAIVHQSPPAGQRVAAGAVVSFEVKR